MNKITADHLSRAAYIYVRQSTPGQLIHNPESRRRQYDLKDRARALGWENVIVIDEDLGHTASGTLRLGFDNLLAGVCSGAAGAVFAIEASRLARNGRDWHTLLEYCALVNCLIIDEDGVHDPKLTNDRLVLGMRGAFSELELSVLRQRSQEAKRLKAARGDLYSLVAVGYVRNADNKLEMDANRRVRETIHLIFRKFAEFGSIRQVVLWLREERIETPIVVYTAEGRMVEWRLPTYDTVHRKLTNPVYAGTYVYGRTGSQISIGAGRKQITRKVHRSRSEWEVLIPDHHEGYISREEYERNQRIISGNANMKGVMVLGSVRNGDGLLAGLLRCGHCGRKLKVFHHRRHRNTRYLCNGAFRDDLQRIKCLAFGNARVDAAVSEEVLRVISPLGLDAALQMIADLEGTATDRSQQIGLALEQARYEATRAHRQYNAVDPENRLVVGDLERRWNERLAEVRRLEEEFRIAHETQSPTLSEVDRAEILALGTDLPRLWSHPEATAATRKRILRTVLEEIVVTLESNRLRLKLHWKGGDHTTLEVERNRTGEGRWKTSVAIEQLIRDLARMAPDRSIAAILNRLGMPTAKGHTWTQPRVTVFRNDHQIAVYRDGERAERGELNLQEAATRLGVSRMTVIRLIRDKLLPAKQSCVGAPYVIREADLDLQAVRRAVKDGRAVTRDPRQRTLEFQ
jgi:excisionase family DNA binding protein